MIKTINKKGIALIALSVVIMILVLLSGIVIYIGYDIMTTSKNTVYARDVEIISDATMEYYAVNGSLPVLEGGKKITADQYKSEIETLLGEEKAIELANEIIENEDQVSVFYEIDISKIGIEDIKYGGKKNENDIFLISNSSHIIYYYIGYENSSGIHFSNSELMDK